MKYLVENKVYDTEKAKKIIKYIKPIKTKGIFGFISYPRYIHTLYKTKKGQFFVYIGEYVEDSDISVSSKDEIELLSDDEVKEILNELNAIDVYQQLFDDLEEG